jgi:hypothetical protein
VPPLAGKKFYVGTSFKKLASGDHDESIHSTYVKLPSLSILCCPTNNRTKL